eukprot:CAMPEP_0197635528 /NCGR_PEP_ID=MMETSP1338-20131121/11322_1 /TAXON_ID=43686 ORGANISM="Pelagodinium beii, Strain RCC1491" /NCGR_SAMPLE_ID=MMETSP1338 /ASSEMBLY_ACC=CAM_ASM_000754 /LENGTH=322 /DNA_ID=CAMNT_0043207603 /DNA_START=45 /DNA_END=1013 /DNA_ORIENTATION=-
MPKGQGGRFSGRQNFVKRQLPQDEDAEEDDEIDGGDFDEEYTAVDEEYVVEDDERKADIEQQILQEACLPVSGAPMPPSEGPPQDADEYLRQVQWERLQCPEIVDVEVKERTSRRRQKNGGPLSGREGASGGLLALFSAPEVPQELQYSGAFAEDAANAFRILRAECLRARQAKPEDQAKQLSYEEWRRVARDKPSLELLAVQDFVSVNHLVVVSVDKLEAYQESLRSGKEPHDEEEEKLQATNQGLDSAAEWTYAALAFVEEPLVDDIQYQLQRLRRVCQRLLASLHEGVSGAEPGGLDMDFVRPRICLLLALVAKNFGQQ